MKLNIITSATCIVTALVFSTTLASAGNDPACNGKDQNVCDTLGAMLNVRGKGCYQMVSVSPIGANGYRITCVVSSSSSTRATYTLKFSSDQTSYTVN